MTVRRATCSSQIIHLSNIELMNMLRRQEEKIDEQFEDLDGKVTHIYHVFAKFIMNKSPGTNTEEEHDNYDNNDECDEEDKVEETMVPSFQTKGSTSRSASTQQTDAKRVKGNLLRAPSESKPAKEAAYCNFEPWPTVKQWRTWKFTFKKTVAGCSGWRPKEAFLWISATEKANTFEELENDEGFDSLSAKVATGLAQIADPDFARQLALREEEAARTQTTMINARQVY